MATIIYVINPSTFTTQKEMQRIQVFYLKKENGFQNSSIAVLSTLSGSLTRNLINIHGGASGTMQEVRIKAGALIIIWLLKT